MIEFYKENIGISWTFYAIWSQKMWSNLQTFYRVYEMSVSVHVYRHCIFQVRYRDFTEILLTFVMSINGSSFPKIHKVQTLATKDSKGPQTNMPNVGSIKTWSAGVFNVCTKIKRLAGDCDEIWHFRSIDGKIIIDRSFDGNFDEFGPFLWDLWSFELGRSALESPAFPSPTPPSQLKI